MSRLSRTPAILLIGLLSAFLPSLIRADDLQNVAPSVKWVPENAAFYSASLRLGEQYQILAQSKAWARLRELPALKQLMAEWHRESGADAEQFKKMLADPENQQLLALLGEMCADEVFCFSGEDLNLFVRQYLEFNTAMRMQGFAEALQGLQAGALAGRRPANPTQASARAMIKVLSEHIGKFKFPQIVIGFRLRKTDAAKAQLERLEKFAKTWLDQHPPLKGSLKRHADGLLTLELKGSMIPEDDLRAAFKDLENEDESKKLIEAIQKLSVTIGLGIRDQYLVLTLGTSVPNLGPTERNLAGRFEFGMLAKHLKERLTSVSYVSKGLRESMGTTKEDIDGMAEWAKQGVGQLPLAPAQQQKVKDYIANVAKDIRILMPEHGAMVGCSFMNDQGVESYSYDWSESPGPDAGRPLSLLDHVGGSPLCAVVARTKYAPQNYEMGVRWIKDGFAIVKEIAFGMIGDEQKKQVESVLEAMVPALERLDRTTSQMLLPSLKASQWAFILDGKIQSKQWQESIPKSDKPLPMLEPALVYEVSDALLLRKAFGEYRAAANELGIKLNNVNPQIPAVSIPEPAVKKTGAASFYYYQLPESLGLDHQISPNAALSDHLLALTITFNHSERLLSSTPLKAGANVTKPSARVVFFDWAGTLTVARPWIDHGIEAWAEKQASEKDPGPAEKKEEVLSQIHTGIDILKCLKTYTSRTYFDGKVTVTHGETVLKDL